MSTDTSQLSFSKVRVEDIVVVCDILHACGRSYVKTKDITPILGTHHQKCTNAIVEARKRGYLSKAGSGSPQTYQLHGVPGRDWTDHHDESEQEAERIHAMQLGCRDDYIDAVELAVKNTDAPVVTTGAIEQHVYVSRQHLLERLDAIAADDETRVRKLDAGPSYVWWVGDDPGVYDE